MVAIRRELEQDIRTFFLTSEGYAADHWYGWLPKALNAHPEIFVLLAHEGSRPKYFNERTRGERPDVIPFTEFLNDMGMTYEAIGDCYSYRAHQMAPVRKAYGDAVPIANLVRHPYAWHEFYVRWRASNMRMPKDVTGPLDWEWKVANHELFKELGLKGYGREDVTIWASYQGFLLMNQLLVDVQSGVKQIPIESITSNPDTFQRLVEFVSKGRCKFSDALLDQVYEFVGTPFRGEEKLRVVPREQYEKWPEWKRAAFKKVVDERVILLYQRFGYRLEW